MNSLNPTRWPVRLAALILLPAASLLVLTVLLPPLDLSGTVGVAAYYVAASGSPWVSVFIALQIGVLVSRPGLTAKRRVQEALLCSALLTVFVGGVFLLNEYAIKSVLCVPRPNIQQLAASGLLGKTAEEFYALPGKSRRGEYLREVLRPAKAEKLCLHPLVCEHWIVETGFSFPSSHSLASFSTASFFLAAGLSCGGWRRAQAMFVVLPWALAVCCSRRILQVHTTLDICFGALEGIVAGLGAFVIVRWALRSDSGQAIGFPETRSLSKL